MLEEDWAASMPHSSLIITSDDNVINIHELNALTRRRMREEDRMTSLAPIHAKMYEG